MVMAYVSSYACPEAFIASFPASSTRGHEALCHNSLHFPYVYNGSIPILLQTSLGPARAELTGPAFSIHFGFPLQGGCRDPLAIAVPCCSPSPSPGSPPGQEQAVPMCSQLLCPCSSQMLGQFRQCCQTHTDRSLGPDEH